MPNPVSSFKDLPVAADLLENVNVCGYNQPTPIQMQAIPIILEVCSNSFLRPSGLVVRTPIIESEHSGFEPWVCQTIFTCCAVRVLSL